MFITFHPNRLSAHHTIISSHISVRSIFWWSSCCFFSGFCIQTCRKTLQTRFKVTCLECMAVCYWIQMETTSGKSMSGYLICLLLSIVLTVCLAFRWSGIQLVFRDQVLWRGILIRPRTTCNLFYFFWRRKLKTCVSSWRKTMKVVSQQYVRVFFSCNLTVNFKRPQTKDRNERLTNH